MTVAEVFKYAYAYDFEKVKEYLDQGGQVNVFDEEGTSLLAELLNGYYSQVFYNDPEEAALFEANKDDDYFEHRTLRKYCRMPLEERPHPIKEQMDYLLAKGADINAVSWENAYKSCEKYEHVLPFVHTPLCYAVENTDFCITKYLLEHGADPRVKLDAEGDYDRDGFEDYLLTFLDMCLDPLVDGDSGLVRENDLEIAALLMHHGLDQWKGGSAIEVQPEYRKIYTYICEPY